MRVLGFMLQPNLQYIQFNYVHLLSNAASYRKTVALNVWIHIDNKIIIKVPVYYKQFYPPVPIQILV
jgi:hypothetical protein